MGKIRIYTNESVSVAIADGLKRRGVDAFSARGTSNLAMAIKLFELGRLSSGQASALTGMPRVTFLLNCHRYGAFSVKLDREEVEAEFTTLERI